MMDNHNIDTSTICKMESQVGIGYEPMDKTRIEGWSGLKIQFWEIWWELSGRAIIMVGQEGA